MCGRYTLTVDHQGLTDLFSLEHSDAEISARYNIAPTQAIPIIRIDPEDGHRTLLSARWGLLPGWRKDPAGGPLLINARAESAAHKPSFRESYRRCRCLIPATGFFEWKATSGGKLPHFIRRADGEPMVMAGLWAERRAPDGLSIISAAVLTVASCEPVSSLHDRMPAMVAREDFDLWLAPTTPLPVLDELLRKAPPPLETWPVSPRVNRVANDDPACVERHEPPQLSLF